MIKKFILAVAAALAAVTAFADTPRYIFYFIGDGMGMGPVMSALTYKRLVTPEAEPLTMTSFPVVSWCQTWSASSSITDSAAAGTALSTGHKTRNSMLGMDADTVAVTSVARILKDRNWGVGLVTSVAPDDATPAAFYAHVPKRSMYYDIDIQAAGSGYDFMAGASLRGTVDKQGNPTDVTALMEQNGVKIFYGPQGIDSIGDTRKVILLGNPATNSNNNDVSYTIDSVAGALTLPMMTEACLEHLERVSPDHFFMMVEGGNIDHALHANDGGAATKEIINFDQAIGVAYRFYLRHPENTLIVVTADHDTGGLTVGNKALYYQANPAYIDHQRISKEAFSEYCKKLMADGAAVPTWEEMHKFLEEKFGLWKAVPVTEKDTEELHEAFNAMVERKGADQKTLYASFNNFAVTVFRVFNNAAGYGFTTTSHTGNPVPVFAIGAGADMFKGLNNNTDIPQKMLQLVK